ncbi:RNA recognition motif domain [Dillenia turbinata]|uniref:Eukaryotic translation initiation factor 3 subunit G n=1 Tax=Dillenia turbinata TaxID=194707 RepID=A0AAN8ZN77_9MAGN
MAIDTERPSGSGSGSNENPPPQNKLLWAEVVDYEAGEEEEASFEFLLPPPVTIGPDENGVKKVIQYKFDGDKNKIKISTTTRLRKLADARLNKRALQRRSWAKFGEDEEKNVSAITLVSTEEILLETSNTRANKAGEANLTADSLSQLGKGGSLLMVCRACGKKGDHWTSRCPNMDFSSQVDDIGPSNVIAHHPVAAKGGYVVPSMRAGGERSSGSDTRCRKDENTLRISNLSQYARESDLLELFGVFGPLNRAFVPINHKTGLSRGFGFVSFVHKEDAARAINRLNGYGYDNLILHVDWSQPQPN